MIWRFQDKENMQLLDKNFTEISCGGMTTIPNKNQKSNKPLCKCEHHLRQLLNGKCRLNFHEGWQGKWEMNEDSALTSH